MATNRIFDDFARIMTDATGAAQGVRREIETTIKTQMEKFIRDMDIATREEVEVLRDQVAALRKENEALTTRVAKLEATRPGAGPTVGASPANDAAAT
jgi:BMFP domain-containing protein YqiC